MILSLFIFVPSLVCTFFGFPSLTYGFIVSFLILAFYVIFVKSLSPTINRKKILLLSAISIIYFINGVCILINRSNLKSLQLLLLSYTILFFIILYSENLLIIFVKEFRKYSKKVLFSLFFLISLSFVYPKLNLGGINSIFIYSEPSHFILSVLPLTIFIYLGSDFRVKILILLFLTLFLIIKKSMLGLLLFTLLVLFSKSYILFSSFSTILCYMFYNYYYLLEYYFDRISIFTVTNNLSLLSLQDGYYRIYHILTSTKWSGLGIGNLGYVNIEGSPFRKRISEIYSGDLNLYDGSFFGAKSITEFGLLGLVFIMFCIFICYRLFLERYYSNIELKSLIFAFCIPFLFETFVRGSSYFTFNIFIFLIILINYLSKKHFFRSFENV